MFKCVDLQTILKTRFWEKNCVRTQNDVDVVLFWIFISKKVNYEDC